MHNTHRSPSHSMASMSEDPIAAGHAYCDLARAAIRPHFRSALAVENKAAGNPAARSDPARHADYDPVTVADRAAEQAIRQAIEHDFPSDGIIGEEFGIVRPDAPNIWVLDPIDGTRAFITGSPLWGTLIGRHCSDGMSMGFMDQAFTGERLWSDGSATWFAHGDGEAARQGQRTATRKNVPMDVAILATTHPDLFATPDDEAAFDRLGQCVRTTRYGGDCYNYALLALGGIDLVVESGLKPYDIAPLIPIIEGAGGVITTWDGQSAHNGGQIIAAGDPSLHAAACSVLKAA